MLQRILAGRLVFTPRADGQGYDFSGPTRFDKLFTGIVAPRPAWMPVSDAGTTHIGAADAFDADYERLLETLTGSAVRAAGSNDKGLRSKSRQVSSLWLA